jgi:hypothetical protein
MIEASGGHVFELASIVEHSLDKGDIFRCLKVVNIRKYSLYSECPKISTLINERVLEEFEINKCKEIYFIAGVSREEYPYIRCEDITGGICGQLARDLVYDLGESSPILDIIIEIDKRFDDPNYDIDDIADELRAIFKDKTITVTEEVVPSLNDIETLLIKPFPLDMDYGIIDVDDTAEKVKKKSEKVKKHFNSGVVRRGQPIHKGGFNKAQRRFFGRH